MTQLRIAVLSQNPELYSTRRIVEACRARNHDPIVIDPLRCYMNITSHQPRIYYREKALDDFDATIPRIGASVTFYGCAVLRQFEMMGVYSLNESVAITRSRDKLRSLQLLSKKGIGLPITGFANSTKMTDNLIDLVGGPPLVIKLLEGTQGVGVVLAETRKAAESVIEAFRGLKANFMVQEFIKEANGEDIRVFIIDGEIVATMRRQAREGEFRSNLHRGATSQMIRIEPEEEELAIRAVQLLGLQVAGVDILRSKRGPLILEVNASPGLEGIEGTTGVDIANEIIHLVEREVRRR